MPALAGAQAILANPAANRAIGAGVSGLTALLGGRRDERRAEAAGAAEIEAARAIAERRGAGASAVIRQTEQSRKAALDDERRRLTAAGVPPREIDSRLEEVNRRFDERREAGLEAGAAGGEAALLDVRRRQTAAAAEGSGLPEAAAGAFGSILKGATRDVFTERAGDATAAAAGDAAAIAKKDPNSRSLAGRMPARRGGAAGRARNLFSNTGRLSGLVGF